MSSLIQVVNEFTLPTLWFVHDNFKTLTNTIVVFYILLINYTSLMLSCTNVRNQRQFHGRLCIHTLLIPAIRYIMFSPLNNDFFCRRNGVEIATLFDQNHVDNHKNSMAGQSILAELEEGDRIQVKHFNKINGRNNILNGSRTFLN